MSRWGFAALLLVLAACQSQPAGSGSAGGAETPDPLAEARQFLAQGQPDAALARLQGATDPEGLLLQGRAWAKKAQTAPAPTPPPAASPAPRGATPPLPPEFKFEELQAVDCFERAVGAKPDLGPGHLALAELLGPHALARLQRVSATASRRPGRRGATPEPVPSAVPGPDASPARVLREYRLAAQADQATGVVEAWILFATSVGSLDDAEAALQELVKRVKERPEPFVRYGDFLLASKKDPEGAIAQYRQALIWKSDDEAVRTKVADIYLGMAADHLSRHEYASAESRIREAQRYVSNRNSPQGLKLQEMQAEVAQIRGRPPGR